MIVRCSELPWKVQRCAMTLSSSSLGTGPMSFISKLNHILSTMDHSCHSCHFKAPFCIKICQDLSRSVKICQDLSRSSGWTFAVFKKSTNIIRATMFTYLTKNTACIECISSPYLRRHQNSAVDPDISMALRSRPFGFGVAEDGSSESLRDAGKLGISATFFGGWSTLIHVSKIQSVDWWMVRRVHSACEVSMISSTVIASQQLLQQVYPLVN